MLEIEKDIAKLRRLIPPEFDAASERKWIEKIAAQAKLSAINIKPLPAQEATAPIAVDRLEVSGGDPYSSVHYFVSMMRLAPRLIGLESLVLEADAGERVRFAARFTYPSYAGPTFEHGVSIAERTARLMTVRDSLAAVTSRAQDQRALDALAALTTEIEGDAVVLTSARVGESVTARGLLLGSAARSDLEKALKKANLQARVERSPAGVCEGFSIAGQPGPAVTESKFTAGGDIFDRASIAFCQKEMKTPRKIALGAAPWFLRARGLDADDAFYLLNDLFGEDFIFDPTNERLDLDVGDSLGVNDVIRALPKADRLVASEGVQPVSLSLHDADLTDILCLLSQVGEREILVPRGLQRRVSVFVDDVPMNAVVARLAPKSGEVSACKARRDTPSSRLRMRQLKLEEVGVADLRLAAMVNLGNEHKAYAYVPGGRMVSLKPDARFFDGTVKSISASGVTFSSVKGDVQLPFVP